jgi:hypothetical protein
MEKYTFVVRIVWNIKIHWWAIAEIPFITESGVCSNNWIQGVYIVIVKHI